MPGLNQRGPMNDGPMTGRGRGLCTGNVAAGQGFVGGYGMGRGGNFGLWAGPTPAVSPQAILQARANMLEAELAEIKNQLNKLSESGK